MATLKENMEAIKLEKDTKILPENLKSGITAFGVTGIFEGSGTTGDGPVKLFETTEEMQADANAEEGDLAVVYRSEIQNMTADMEVTSITFPETVTLPTAFTGSANCRLRAVDSGVMFDGNCNLNKISFRFDGYSGTGMIRVEYTSTDGITYTRTRFQADSGDLTNPVELPTTCKVEGEWNDNLGYFMQIGGGAFEGLYQSQSIKVKNTYILDNNRIKIAQYDNFNDSQYALIIKHKFSENEISEYTLLTMNKYIYPFIDSNNKLWVYNSNLTTSLEEYSVNAESYSSRSIIAKTSISNGAIVNNITDIGITVDLDSCIPLGNPLYSGDSTDVVKTIDELTKIKDISTIEPEQVYELKYLPALTQLNATPEYVYEKEFYGVNGVETGKLATSASTTWTDTTAKLYKDIELMYENMDTIKITGTSELNSNMYIIPRKLDGTSLLDTSELTSAGRLFSGYDNLIYIPLLEFSNVTNMQEMCMGSSNLKGIAKLNTSKVTTMLSAFDSCTNLTDVPEFDTSSCTTLQAAFASCPNLSDESLNNILAMCINSAVTDAKYKYLAHDAFENICGLGLSSSQATRCATLSNYQAFLDAGWTTGY